MSDSKNVTCEYLVDNQLCRAVKEDEEGTTARQKSCVEAVKNSCCYLCSHKVSCEISCDYLDKSGTSRTTNQKSVNVDQEIERCHERIARLAGLFADGKIGEESFAVATKSLENRIESLKKAKDNPNVVLSSSAVAGRFEDASDGRPTLLWYIVPFLFGILGGLIGYVATKDEDKDMANGMLFFGILWSFILYFFYWIVVISILFR